jgi:hypothetical protein
VCVGDWLAVVTRSVNQTGRIKFKQPIELGPEGTPLQSTATATAAHLLKNRPYCGVIVSKTSHDLVKLHAYECLGSAM